MARINRWFAFSLLRGLFACLLGVMLTHPAAAAGESQETKHVLVLYSEQTSVPEQEEVNQGLRAALQATKHPAVNIEIEFLDIERFAEPAYQNELLNVLLRKYAHRRLDVIIPVFHPAVKFLQQYGELIFKDVPVVFTAELQPFLQDLTLRPNMTGAYAAPDIAPNLNMATGLAPQTRKVVVVGGVSGPDRIYQSWIRAAFAPFADRVELTYLTDHTLGELQERLAHLPPHSIIFFITFAKDPTGREFHSTEALKLMAKAANAPIFGFYDTLLGEGIVGGSLISFQEQGRLAGELAVRILKGEKPENLPPVLAANPLLFDWRQLQRWGLKEGDLPAGSQIRFKEPSLWESHKKEIIWTTAAFSLLSLLIVGLLINLGRRRRAEKSLARRLEFETLLAELSARFVAVEAHEVDREIDQGLKRLGEFLGVDRVRLWKFNEDVDDKLVSTHFWAAPGIDPNPISRLREHFPWIISQFMQDKPVVFSRPEELPEEAHVDRQYMMAYGIKSFLSLPLAMGSRFMGPLSIAVLRSHKVWPPGLVQELRPIGEIFTNALMRTQAEKELREAELKYRIMTDFTYDWEYWKNLDGTLRYVSPSCERISGYQPQAFISRPELFREIIVPEDRDLWEAHECDALENQGVREVQFRVQRRDGAILWIEHVCQPVTDEAGRFSGIRGSNRDITKRKEAEIQEQQHREDLARVGRVATLSELTGSLAHEIMQPLMAIMNNAQAARRLLDNADPDLGEVKEIIDDITKGSERASGVIHQLRQHLKPGSPELSQLDVNDLVQSLLPLVARQAASSHINLVCQLAQGLPPITGNRIQLEQVILNLVVNGIEAIKGMAGGPREIVLQTDREDEHTLRVSVLDSGPGVKPEDLQRLFDPFFTTRKEGMGLGLSISRSIIKAHRGRLWAAPNPGGGTALHLTLPVTQEQQ